LIGKNKKPGDIQKGIMPISFIKTMGEYCGNK